MNYLKSEIHSQYTY